jgi:acyl-CoA thioesterase I
MAIRRIVASVATALALFALASVGARAEPLHVVALGDSLTAGYGLQAQDAFPARLQAELVRRGLDIVIDNAGVSGDTAADGLARLDWSVPDGTRAVLLELGANDMLRGIDPERTGASLDKMVSRLKARGIAVMILGMRAAPNLGPEFKKAFDGIFPRIAARYGVPLYPFFLDGVAAERSLNQADGMHPTARGVEVIVERLAPSVESFLRSLS